MPGFFEIDDSIEQECTYDYSKMSPDANCMKCGLFKHSKSPQMKVSGKGRKQCLIIAEAPGPDEDEMGTQLVGRVGQFFRDKLKERNLDLDLDFYKVNAINCFPSDGKGGFRDPKSQEIEFCKPFVEAAIKETTPEYIWLMGKSAITSFLAKEFNIKSVSQWRGYAIPDTKYNCWVLPMLHPSWALRNEYDFNSISVYNRDLDNAVKILNIGRPSPLIDYKSRIHSLTNFQEILDLLDYILKNITKISIDYETTGLKPFVVGHAIVCVSCAFLDQRKGSVESYSFPYQYSGVFSEREILEIKRRWVNILINPKIKKIIQNLQFEWIWSKVIFGVDIKNIIHDTMLCSHTLDSRSLITNLNFQIYKNFGVYPYDFKIDRYKKAENSNAFNNMMKCPLPDLLEYSALDSLFIYWLAGNQITELYNREKRTPKIREAFQFLMDGALDFAEMTYDGINTDEDYYFNEDNRIKSEIEILKNKLRKDKFGAEFRNRYGTEFDISKNDHKRWMFYNIMQMPEILTESEKNLSTSKKALAQVENEFVRRFQLIKKYEKLSDTFIAQFLREVTYGKIHPFYNLHIARSYRSSSDSPNMQNIPEHDTESKDICKRGIKPSPGNLLLEWDFGGIEVCISCCYHKDPNMIKYITDKSTDMHRDSAMDITLLPKEEITKDIRFHCGKNGWVFPQFYGDYYVSCAKEMWRQIIQNDLQTVSGKSLIQHLDNKGLRDLNSFTEHCRSVEKIFWEDRFPVYNEWKKKVNYFFQKKGHIQSFLGFEFCGLLGRNDCTNHQIQGTAFHMLLWTKLQIRKLQKKEGWKSKPIFQVHDSGAEDTFPPEKEHIIKSILYYGTEVIRENFPWIIVPMTIEFTESEIDGNWADKKIITI